MKKILFPALALILAACAAPHLTPDTSHVTLETPTLPPPTETPVPTPTLHPQFLSLQTQLASSGETFTLNQNGEIEMWTKEQGMTIVPDIKVNPDGTMTFTHDGRERQVDTQTLTIEGQTITFKDTNGKTWVFDGEDWEDKTAEVKLAEDMKIFKLSLDDYKITYDAEGKIELRDRSNKLVYWDGKWQVDKILKIIADKKMCMPTEYPLVGGNYTIRPLMREFGLYLEGMRNEANEHYDIGGGYFAIYIKGTKNCWAVQLGGIESLKGKIIKESTHIAWRDTKGKLIVVPIFLIP